MARRSTDWMLERMLRAFTDAPGEPVYCRLITTTPWAGPAYPHVRRDIQEDGMSENVSIPTEPLLRYWCDDGHEPVEWSGRRRKRCWFCRKPGKRGSAPVYEA